MAVIHKKILSKYFDAILSGKKNFELRLNDFEVAPGDTLVLEEWDNEHNDYTGRKIEKQVSYVYPFRVDDLFWSEAEIKDKGLQIISIV